MYDRGAMVLGLCMRNYHCLSTTSLAEIAHLYFKYSARLHWFYIPTVASIVVGAIV